MFWSFLDPGTGLNFKSANTSENQRLAWMQDSGSVEGATYLSAHSYQRAVESGCPTGLCF